MKKLISFLCICLCSIAIHAEIETGTCGGNLTWSYDSETQSLTITGSGDMTDYKSSSDVPWYHVRESILSVALPERLMSIGSSAFSGCSGLTSITIPESVTSIGDCAFLGCLGLTSIAIPDGVTSIGYWAFCGCSSLTSITIPDGVTSIEFSTFERCSSLTSIIIPESVTSIGASAFWGCSSLTSITIPDGVTSIEACTFTGCSALTVIALPDGVTSIGDYAFDGCSGLTSITIPNSVKSIGVESFRGCSGLTSITIPDGVTSIGDYAFYNILNIVYNGPATGSPWGAKHMNCYVDGYCVYESEERMQLIECSTSATGEIIIPESVTSIGDDAFYGCSGLTSIIIPESVTSIEYGAFANCSGLSSITIPESVTSIGDDAFYGCSGLTSITIPESVTSIGDYAFYGCSGLTSIIWNAKTCNNPSYKEGSPFYYIASQITSFTFGSEVEYIPAYLCYGMSKLASITIPDGVTSIGSSAFFNVLNIVYHGSATGSPWGARSVNGCIDGYLVFESEAKTQVVACSIYATDITIPNGVTSIGDYAFNGCSGLTSVTIPNGVKSIGVGSFHGCSGLTSVTIPESVTSIGWAAFADCASLMTIMVDDANQIYDSRDNCNALIETSSNTLVAGCKSTTIPESVTSIGDYAFSGCSSLTSIAIPESVTSIGEGVFSGCSGLTSITIPESVTSIGRGVVINCSRLTSIIWNAKTCNNPSTEYYSPFYYIASQITSFTFGTEVEHIPAYLCYGMSKLTSITIPDGVTSIGLGAFYGCSGLTSVTIPASVTSIGWAAFADCASLMTIMVDDANPICDSRDNCNAIIGTSSNTLIVGCKNTIIPESVTSIGSYAFYSCRGLTSITIPDGVTSIGDYAFYGCSGLTSVTIGREVTTIRNYAFDTGSQFDTIVVRTTTPPVCSSFVFGEINDVIWNVPVSIPCGSLSAYQAAEVWLSFTDIVETFFPFALSMQPAAEGTGSVQIVGEPTCMETTISATPNRGYMFAQWSDGNTDNPRTVILTQDTAFTAVFAPLSGMCGDDLYWQYRNKTIEITGTGEMYNYADNTQPWLLLRDSTAVIRIGHSATSIGENAFAQMGKLSELHIGAGMKTIGANAFAGCRYLFDIYCYPAYPPTAENSSFANYNVYIHVPCETQREYMLDMVFGSFKYIECMGSEEVTLPSDDVMVTPTTDDATFTWPTDDSAETYTLVITKDGVVFCTLVFNANGQLTTIAFKPSRQQKAASESSAAQQTYATATANGFRFTVTGLDEDTHYAYTLTVRDAANAVVTTYEGDFTTESNTPTGILTTNQETLTVQKIFHNGQVLILRDGKAYNLLGQEVR